MAVGLQAQPDFNQGKIQQQHFTEVIPIEWENNKILIATQVSDQKGKFLLDTGAPTLLSKSFFETLNLAPSGNIKVVDANGNSEPMPYLIIPKIEIGALVFTNIPALVIDFENSPLKCVNDTIHGFIGSNLLKELIVQFNIPQRALRLTDQPDDLELPSAGLSLSLDNGGQPILDIQLGDEQTTAFFDTGFNGLYSITKEIFEQNKTYFESIVIAKGKGSSGQTGIYGSDQQSDQQYLLKLPEFRIGNHLIEDVCTIPSPGDKALIGTELFEYGQVTLDYINKRFYLTNFNTGKDAYENFGFEWGLSTEEEWEVALVFDNTEAAQKGLEAHQKILAINDLELQNRSFCQTDAERRNILKKENKVSFKLLDLKGQVIQLELQKIHWNNLPASK